MAIDFWNEIAVERSDKFSISVSGVDNEHISCEIDEVTGETSNLLFKAFRRSFLHCGVPMFPLKVTCKNTVPLCSGLGSSVRCQLLKIYNLKLISNPLLHLFFKI